MSLKDMVDDGFIADAIVTATLTHNGQESKLQLDLSRDIDQQILDEIARMDREQKGSDPLNQTPFEQAVRQAHNGSL